MDFFAETHDQNTEVADLYAGFVEATLHIDVKQELEACLVGD